MLKTSDVELLDRSLGNLGDTLLQNRMMKQEQARYAQEQQRLQQQAQATQAERSATEQERTTHDRMLEDLMRQRVGVSQENADTGKAKGSKVFYFVSPSTKNVKSFTGTAAEAQAQLEKIQATKPTEGMVMTDKEPDGLKDLNEIPIDDQHTLHASDADALKFYEQKMAAKAKVDAAKEKPTAQTSPRQEVHQVKNPERVVGGVVNTNVPATLSLTNTVTPLNIGDSGLPNLAPAPSATPAAKPTPKDVAYLAAHPELKAKFEARFGAGSASQYLP